MLICPQRKFIFFKPLKCAGTSVEHALYAVTGPDALCTGSSSGSGEIEYDSRNNELLVNGQQAMRFVQHTPPGLFYSRVADPDWYYDYANITIVRNPWDSLVSFYWWCVRRAGTAEEWIIKPDDSPGDMVKKFETVMTMPAIYSNDLIAHEIGLGASVSSAFIFFHTLNNLFIDDRIDCYLHFESLERDFSDLCAELQINDAKLHKHKTSQRKMKSDYRKYYNSWMRNIVAEKFSSYIKKFNYSF